MTEKLSAWLEGLLAETPGWDALGPGEGAALFPQGERELWRRTDILGNRQRRIRYTLLLRLSTARKGAQMAAFFYGLSRRIEENAPLLGQDQKLTVENARQTRRDGKDRAQYELKLVFEFTE